MNSFDSNNTLNKDTIKEPNTNPPFGDAIMAHKNNPNRLDSVSDNREKGKVDEQFMRQREQEQREKESVDNGSAHVWGQPETQVNIHNLLILSNNP